MDIHSLGAESYYYNLIERFYSNLFVTDQITEEEYEHHMDIVQMLNVADRKKLWKKIERDSLERKR